jgi:hypothetical protein
MGRFKLFPMSVSPPEDSACYEVSVEAAGSTPSVVAAQRARRRGGYCEGDPGSAV